MALGAAPAAAAIERAEIAALPRSEICLSAAGAAAVGAGTVAAAGSVGLEEVVVTAQKRATNLQDTPIAIATMGSEDLARRHIQSLSDLSDGAIPSLRVEPMFSRSSALAI